MGARCINCEGLSLHSFAEVLESINPAYTVYKYLKGSIIKEEEDKVDEVHMHIISSIDSNLEDSQ